MSLKFLGLLIIFAGFLAKAVIQRAYPNGIIIDLCRLSFFVGVIILVVGFFRKSPKK